MKFLKSSNILRILFPRFRNQFSICKKPSARRDIAEGSKAAEFGFSALILNGEPKTCFFRHIFKFPARKVSPHLKFSLHDQIPNKFPSVWSIWWLMLTIYRQIFAGRKCLMVDGESDEMSSDGREFVRNLIV